MRIKLTLAGLTLAAAFAVLTVRAFVSSMSTVWPDEDAGITALFEDLIATDAERREAAQTKLEKNGDAAYPQISRAFALESVSTDVRHALIWFLLNRDSVRAPDSLYYALFDEDPTVARSARYAFSALTGYGGDYNGDPDALKEIKEWWVDTREDYENKRTERKAIVSLFREAVDAARKEEFGLAAEKLEAVHEKEPENRPLAICFAEMSILHARYTDALKGKHEPAARWIEKAILAAPGGRDSLYHLTIRYMLAGESADRGVERLVDFLRKNDLFDRFMEDDITWAENLAREKYEAIPR